MERFAHLVVVITGWSGWSENEESTEYRFALTAVRGQSIVLAELGLSGKDLEAARRIFLGSIRLMTLLADRAWLEFRHLALVNPNGTIRMGGPYQGIIVIRPGSLIELASPTMDAGNLYSVRLDHISLNHIQDQTAEQNAAPGPFTASPEVSS